MVINQLHLWKFFINETITPIRGAQICAVFDQRAFILFDDCHCHGVTVLKFAIPVTSVPCILNLAYTSIQLASLLTFCSITPLFLHRWTSIQLLTSTVRSWWPASRKNSPCPRENFRQRRRTRLQMSKHLDRLLDRSFESRGQTYMASQSLFLCEICEIWASA